MLTFELKKSFLVTLIFFFQSTWKEITGPGSFLPRAVSWIHIGDLKLLIRLEDTIPDKLRAQSALQINYL